MFTAESKEEKRHPFASINSIISEYADNKGNAPGRKDYNSIFKDENDHIGNFTNKLWKDYTKIHDEEYSSTADTTSSTAASKPSTESKKPAVNPNSIIATDNMKSTLNTKAAPFVPKHVKHKYNSKGELRKSVPSNSKSKVSSSSRSKPSSSSSSASTSTSASVSARKPTTATANSSSKMSNAHANQNRNTFSSLYSNRNVKANANANANHRHRRNSNRDPKMKPARSAQIRYPNPLQNRDLLNQHRSNNGRAPVAREDDNFLMSMAKVVYHAQTAAITSSTPPAPAREPDPVHEAALSASRSPSQSPSGSPSDDEGDVNDNFMFHVPDGILSSPREQHPRYDYNPHSHGVQHRNQRQPDRHYNRLMQPYPNNYSTTPSPKRVNNNNNNKHTTDHLLSPTSFGIDLEALGYDKSPMKPKRSGSNTAVANCVDAENELLTLELPQELQPQTSLEINIQQNLMSILHDNDEDADVPHVPSLVHPRSDNHSNGNIVLSPNDLFGRNGNDNNPRSNNNNDDSNGRNRNHNGNDKANDSSMIRLSQLY